MKRKILNIGLLIGLALFIVYAWFWQPAILKKPQLISSITEMSDRYIFISFLLEALTKLASIIVSILSIPYFVRRLRR